MSQKAIPARRPARPVRTPVPVPADFQSLDQAHRAALVQHVHRLQQDHGRIEEDWRELAPQVEAIAAGYDWYDPAMLQAAVPVFAELCREHIALEECVVYPAAQNLLRHAKH